MDKVTKEVRSKIMSQIKGKNTIPEITLFKALRKANLNFKKHYKVLGNPDVAFPSLKVAVFVDGGFWHGFDYKKRKDVLPEYWVAKIKRNMDRDKRYTAALASQGWRVVRFWEHQVTHDITSVIKDIQIVVEEEKTKKLPK